MMLSGHEHLLLFECSRARVCVCVCVCFCDLTGKSFWSGRHTTKEPLTDVSIIEQTDALVFSSDSA